MPNHSDDKNKSSRSPAKRQTTRPDAKPVTPPKTYACSICEKEYETMQDRAACLREHVDELDGV